MRFGEPASFSVETVDKKGRGRGHIGAREACAYFAVPGERVEGTLYARRQGVLFVSTDRIVDPSPHRVAPRCAFAGTCGGCAWQQFDYDLQIDLKGKLIAASLERAGIAMRPKEVERCPDLYAYRNRMDYCIGPSGELGLKEPGRWNAYLDLTECHLLSPDAVKLMEAFRGWMRAHRVTPWDARSHTGYARYLVIREGKATGKRMATVVTSAGTLPAKDELVAALAPFASTVYHGVNPLITDLSLAPELALLSGDPFLEERVGGFTFRIHPNSFFQTNTVMAGRLLATVAAFLSDRPPKTLLDLYCGVGFFGIGLAASAGRVIGIESDAQAIGMARMNAEDNGIANAEFHAAKAETLVWERSRPDAVIVDPPRSGLHPDVIRTLLAQGPERIVYVSCNHESFARDYQALAAGYRPSAMSALDLFPHSPHVELVTLLVKR